MCEQKPEGEGGGPLGPPESRPTGGLDKRRDLSLEHLTACACGADSSRASGRSAPGPALSPVEAETQLS